MNIDLLLERLQAQLSQPEPATNRLFGLSPGPDRHALLETTVELIERTNANEESLHEARGIYGELLNRGLSRDLAKLLTLVTLHAEMGAEIDGLAQEVMRAAFALVPEKPQWLKDHEATVARDGQAYIDALLSGWPVNNNGKGEK